MKIKEIITLIFLAGVSCQEIDRKLSIPEYLQGKKATVDMVKCSVIILDKNCTSTNDIIGEIRIEFEENNIRLISSQLVFGDTNFGLLIASMGNLNDTINDKQAINFTENISGRVDRYEVKSEYKIGSITDLVYSLSLWVELSKDKDRYFQIIRFLVETDNNLNHQIIKVDLEMGFKVLVSIAIPESILLDQYPEDIHSIENYQGYRFDNIR